MAVNELLGGFYFRVPPEKLLAKLFYTRSIQVPWLKTLDKQLFLGLIDVTLHKLNREDVDH